MKHNFSKQNLIYDVARSIRNNETTKIILGNRISLPSPQTIGTNYQQESYSLKLATEIVNKVINGRK